MIPPCNEVLALPLNEIDAHTEDVLMRTKDAAGPMRKKTGLKLFAGKRLEKDPLHISLNLLVRTKAEPHCSSR